MTGAILASRTFTIDDQLRFAALTHDSNPVHVDPLAARRTQFGQPVVHGVHGLIWALDAVAQQGAALDGYRGLVAHFRKPILLGDKVEATTKSKGDHLIIELAVDGLVTSRITLSGRPPTDLDADGPVTLPEGPAQAVRRSPAPLSLADMAEARAAFAYAAPEIAAAFPAAARALGAATLEALAASTYVVGMECPGLHSIYSRLVAELHADQAGGFAFATSFADEGTRIAQVAMGAPGFRAMIEAFARMPPADGPQMAEIRALVVPNQFAGQRAFIVGASRGLGAATARLIAAGGGEAIITYARGAGEASAVAADIAEFGGRCKVVPYDALAPAGAQLPEPFDANAVYYFAASPIARRKTRGFDADLLHEFIRFHVDGFAQLAEAACGRSGGRMALFYPSSAYAEDGPKDLGEYAAAKRAGEAIAENLAKRLAGARFIVERLPPIDTDQNASVIASETISAGTAMLPLIVKMQAALTD